jgi:hypothetical protein
LLYDNRSLKIQENFLINTLFIIYNSYFLLSGSVEAVFAVVVSFWVLLGVLVCVSFGDFVVVGVLDGDLVALGTELKVVLLKPDLSVVSAGVGFEVKFVAVFKVVFGDVLVVVTLSVVNDV